MSRRPMWKTVTIEDVAMPRPTPEPERPPPVRPRRRIDPAKLPSMATMIRPVARRAVSADACWTEPDQGIAPHEGPR